MADSILRLKVDSQEYDQKIKRAAEGIQQYAQKCRDAGGTLQYLGDGVLEFVQALGQMDTVATSTKQQLREMTVALTDLTATYRGLTDEEKNSPFGQELASSIQQLTERAGRAKDAMTDVAASIQNASSDTRLFDQMAQGASVVTAGFQGLTGAGKLLGINMGDNVELIAKLQAAMAVTNSLTTIQTALQRESALMQGLMAAKATLSATAHGILAGEITAATIAQKAFNLAMKAAPWALAATAIYAVCDAMGLFSSSTDSAAESQSGFNSVLDETKRKIDAIIESEERLKQTRDYLGGKGKYETMVEDLESLQRQWDELERLRKTHLAPPRPGNTQSNIVKEGHIEEYNQIVDQQNQIATQARKLQENIKAYEDAAVYLKTEWRFLTDPREIRAAINLFTDEFNNLDTSRRFDKEAQVLQDKINYLQDNLRKLKTGTGKATGSKTSKADETETQKLQKNIESLTKEYQNLSDVEKVSDVRMVAGIEARKTAIRDEIKTNKQRIDELKKFADEAQGNIKEAKVEMATGTSIQNQAGLSDFIGAIKKQLSEADFGTDLYNSLSTKLADLTSLQNLVGESLKAGLGTALFDVADETGADFWTRAMEGGVENIEWQSIVDKINEKRKEAGLDAITLDFNTGNVGSEKKQDKKGDSFDTKANKFISGLSEVSNGLTNLGVKMPEKVNDLISTLSSIMQVIKGVQSIISLFQVSAITANTAAIAANTTALITNSAISLIPGLANGGIVHAAGGFSIPGNRYSGDLVPAFLNSGELVLNRAQQGVLASELSGGGMQNIRLEAVVSGEQIMLASNNRGLRTGRGEIVQSRRVR